MHLLSHINYGISIEKELLSNSTNSQEYFDTKALFDSLKSISRHDRLQLNKPAKNNKSSLKDFALRLLLATGYSPVSNLASNITSKNNLPIIPGLQCNTNISSFGSKHTIKCSEHILPVMPAGNNTNNKFDYGLMEEHNVRRIIRSPEQSQSMHSPPNRSALEGLTSLLISESHITSKELESTYNVIKALDEFLSKNNDAFKKVTQSLLKSSGLFGYKDQELLTQCHQQKIMAAWINSFVFNDNIEKFIVSEFMTLTKKNHGKAVYTRDFANHLSKGVENLLQKNPSEYMDVNQDNPPKVIFDRLLNPLMPTFFQGKVNTSAMAYSVGSIEWGFFHVGLGLAMSADINLETLSANDISSLGIILEALLKEGITAPNLIKLFMIPAMLYHVKYCHDNNISTDVEDIFWENRIRQHILAQYFSACDRYHAAKDPVACLTQRLDTYQSLADLVDALHNLNSNILIKPQEYYFSYYEYDVFGDVLTEEINETKIGNWHTPDPYSLFERQSVEIADTFADVDKNVIRDAFNGMHKKETQFLNAAMVTLSRVSLEYNYDSERMQSEERFCQIEELDIRKDVDVFSATIGDEERMYALMKEKEEYQIRRITSSITSYYDYLSYFKPELDTDSIKLTFSQDSNEILKDTHDSLQVLAGKLSQIHRNKMLQYLNAYGYDNRASFEKKTFFPTIVPFYICNKDDQAAKQDTKNSSCSIDFAALSSIAGKSDLDLRTPIKTKYDSRTASGGMASGLAARQSFVMAMKQGPSSLVKTIELPASHELNPIALSKLGVEYLLMFDPGLEINSGLSEVMFKQIAEGVAVASRSLPSLQRLHAAFVAKKIDPAGNQLVKQYEMAHLPSMELEVPVVKVGGDTFHSKDIYLRLNPENNDIYSQKYTLAEDKTLIPVPMPQGEKLHNFLVHYNEEICTLIGDSSVYP
ncbi:hypothetical protein ACL2XO_22185 [Sodalis sp. RH15]|uniref:hypothetical protein n=1 Tax=Sodalis sp. RH15 TaxID=3394330 RepID=UPI0039B4AA24